LQRAYELGRRALAEGLGVLEMVTIHREAVERLFGQRPESERERIIAKAMEFLGENLSPFEMTHRGFQEANTRLRLLSEHLQTIREEERTRIAGDIHDELGQVLTALKMDLFWLGNRLSSASGRPKGTARPSRNAQRGETEPGKRDGRLEKMETMLKLTDQAIQTVRRIATELRPAVLDDLGLAAAIEWQAREFQARSGVRCRLALVERSIRLDPKRTTAVFRIFQETMTNVARHANAARVDVRLKKKNDDLILTIRDDGRGITEREIAAVQSLGLLGMRERALFLGGEFQIIGIPGRGTTVTLRIPTGGRTSTKMS